MTIDRERLDVNHMQRYESANYFLMLRFKPPFAVNRRHTA